MKKTVAIIIVLMLLFNTVLAQGLPSEWARPEIEQAVSIGFVPTELLCNYTDNITRREFAKLGVLFFAKNLGYTIEELSVLAQIRSAPAYFDDCDDEYVLLAAEIGIVKGMGDAKFSPDEPITREQAATMLHRTYHKYARSNIYTDELVYKDSAEMADWATEAIRFCYDYNIMRGISATQFAPKAFYTKEQAIATFLRMYNNRAWEEDKYTASYVKKVSKEEALNNLLKNEQTQLVKTVVDNEYGMVVYLKTTFGALARHSLFLIAPDSTVYPLGAGAPVLEKMSGATPPVTNITVSDWGSVISYEQLYSSQDFSQSSPDTPRDGILRVRVNLITRECVTEFVAR